MYIFLFILLTTKAMAWGFLGHKTIALIAENNLTTTTKKNLLIIQHKEPLTKLSIWPDTVRNYYPHTTSWHFLSIPKIPFKNLQQDQHKGQLEKQLCINIKILTTKANTHWQEKHQALSWVIHLVGDAHQPLHIGNGKDFGANNCYVKWYKRKKPVKLHKIWDTFLVTTLLKKGLHRTNQSINFSKVSAPPIEWIKESRLLHNTVYPKNKHLYCDSFKKTPKLNQTYTKRMLPIVNERLVLAGKRLAFILNYIYDENFRKKQKISTNWNNCLKV